MFEHAGNYGQNGHRTNYCKRGGSGVLEGFSLLRSGSPQVDMPRKPASEEKKRLFHPIVFFAILIKHLVFSLLRFLQIALDRTCRECFCLFCLLPFDFLKSRVLGGKAQWILRALGRVGNSSTAVLP